MYDVQLLPWQTVVSRYTLKMDNTSLAYFYWHFVDILQHCFSYLCKFFPTNISADPFQRTSSTSARGARCAGSAERRSPSRRMRGGTYARCTWARATGTTSAAPVPRSLTSYGPTMITCVGCTVSLRSLHMITQQTLLTSNMIFFFTNCSRKLPMTISVVFMLKMILCLYNLGILGCFGEKKKTDLFS